MDKVEDYSIPNRFLLQWKLKKNLQESKTFFYRWTDGGAIFMSINLPDRVKEEVCTSTYTFDSLLLQNGGRLVPVTLAYKTWGTLNATADNAVLITHHLSGNTLGRDAKQSDNPQATTWNPLIGPGHLFDASRYFVICSNILGGCDGSTGPSSLNRATSKSYRMDFPCITIRDMVHAQHHLIDHFGVNKLALVAGASLGGQLALEWAVTYPEMVSKVVVITATDALNAQAIAFHEGQRQAIMADHLWEGGGYKSGRGPSAGLSSARILAMITYLSDEVYEQRFECNGADTTARSGSSHLRRRFDIERYLYHQGKQLTRHFDANSYLYVSRAMDAFDVSQGYPSLDAALHRLRSKALFVGIRSDFLFPAARVRWLAEKVCALGGDATYVEIDSIHGYDTFLKEWRLMTATLDVRL